MRDYALHNDIAGRASLGDYMAMTKPGIVSLVLVSSLTGMYLGGKGVLDAGVLTLALLGIGLATAGSCVLNNYFDRDIDRLMRRTSTRALAREAVPHSHALAFGLLMLAASVPVLALGVNPLTAALTMLASFIYVVLYGMVLKRRTPAANQIGGLSGALPPAMGYAAATGTVGVEVLALFAIVALWQQPHALSLALKYTDDYRAASIPVIPVAKGVGATKWRILLYTLALLPASAAPYLFGTAGAFYLAVAVVTGAAYVALSAMFAASKRECSMPLFFYSIIYLTVLFAALVLDMGRV